MRETVCHVAGYVFVVCEAGELFYVGRVIGTDSQTVGEGYQRFWPGGCGLNGLEVGEGVDICRVWVVLREK